LKVKLFVDIVGQMWSLFISILRFVDWYSGLERI
jgi:hypothetical protein